MLDKKVFKVGIDKLLMFFPNWSINAESVDVMREWHGMFKDCDNDGFLIMVDKYITKETYNPSFSGLIKYHAKKTKITGRIRDYNEVMAELEEGKR